MRFLRRFIYLVSSIYVLAALGLFFVQGKMIYFPDARNLTDCNLPSGVEIWREGDEQGLLSASGNENLLLFFHGNGDSACNWRYLGVNHITQLGYDVLVVEYPGYGGDKRTPTKSLIEESLAVVNQWRQREPYSGVSVMGYSLGSGVASVYAQKYGADRVLLFAPYDSVYSVALGQGFYFPEFLLRENFDNIDALSSVGAIISILHGAEDAVIPAKHSEILFARLSDLGRIVRRDTIVGVDHNGLFDTPRFDRYMKEVLAVN